MTYGCMLAQESTLSKVIQYKTIPFILQGKIPFTKLSLSQTFTNTELMQPHFSLSLLILALVFFSLKLLDPMSWMLSDWGPAGKVC